jgi:hypothetical protein
MLVAVILLGVLIVIALGVLVVGLVTRYSGRGHPSATNGAAEFTLAPDTRLVAMDVAADRLVLRLRGPAGDEIDIIDTQSGRLLAKIRSAVPPPRK